MNKKKTSTERFTFSNAIVNSKLPAVISTERYMENFSEAADIKFGFFDQAVPDYSTYYPDISAEDLAPKDDDYYMPLVRALSKVILNKWGPIDFSEGGILKASIDALNRQTLYGNHEVMVGNEVGVVFKAVWQDAFTDEKGNIIPAGINARLKIDSKQNPRLVRNMRMDPPAVHSFSVGVTFDWEKSHPKMDESDFWRSLGTYGKDGKLIRRVVSEIVAYHELSLVPHGADPYAQIISEKGINNADYAKRVLKFPSKEINETHKNTFHFGSEDFTKNGHVIDYAKTYGLSLTEDNENTILNENKPNNKSKLEMDLQEFLNSLSQIKALDLTGDDNDVKATLAAVTSLAESLEEAEKNITTLTSERDKAKTDLEEANNKLAAATPKVDSYEKVLQATKEEATRLYKLCKGDEASTEMLEMISKAPDHASALAFLNQFKKDSEGQFSGKCLDCGSSKVTRASSEEGKSGVIDPKKDDNLDDSTEEKNTEGVFADIRKAKTKFNTSRIHGAEDAK